MQSAANKKVSLILGVVVLVLLVLGLGAGYFVSQQQQDIRQQAAIDCSAFNNNQPGCASAGCNWAAASVAECLTTFTSKSACDSVSNEGCNWQAVPVCMGTYINSSGQNSQCTGLDLETCAKKPPVGCEYRSGYCSGLYSSSSGICSGPANVCINSPLGQVNLGCGVDACASNAQKVCTCDGNAQVISCSCIANPTACGGNTPTPSASTNPGTTPPPSASPSTNPGTDPGTDPGSGTGGGTTPTTRSFNGTVVAEDTGTTRYMTPVVSATCLNGNCSGLTWASDSYGGHFDAKAGNVVSVSITPKAGYSSCNYTVVERNCSTLQTIKTHTSGTGCIATFEKTGTDCDWKYGVNFTMLKNPQPVTASYNAICTPGQEYSADGSKLSYDFSFTNINPTFNFERAIVFLSIGAGELNATQEASFEAKFGKPTWASNGENPTCVNQDWCGYWFLSSYTYSPTIFLQGQKFVPGTSTLRYFGGTPLAGQTKGTMQDLVAWGQANGKTNWNFGATVSVNGGSTTGLNRTLSILPNACAPAPVTKTWTITTDVVCANPAITPTNVPRRLVWSLWPPTPVTWLYNPALSAAGATTDPTQVITVNGVVPSLVQNVYMGMVSAADGSTWGGKTYLPLTPPAGIVTGKFFTSQSDLFQWSVPALANGTINLKFQAPPEQCVVPSPSPSPSPSPTPTPTPTPSPSASAVATPSATPTGSPIGIGGRPSPSPTSGIIMSPSPGATTIPAISPSPVASPLAGPMCLGICATVNGSGPCTTSPQLAVGSRVSFTCTEVPGVSQYSFRIVLPNGTVSPIAATGRVTAPFRITQKGTYIAQCQICPNGQCLPFILPSIGPAASPLASPVISPISSPQGTVIPATASPRASITPRN